MLGDNVLDGLGKQNVREDNESLILLGRHGRHAAGQNH